MPQQSTDPGKRLGIAAALWLAISLTPASAAAQSEDAVRAMVAQYFAAHNAHRLDEVMAFYADTASFTLTMGRGTVVGKPQVRNLELFDAMAGSVLHPFGASFEKREDGWHMHLAGVLESSSVFRAMGLHVVRTQPIRSTFVIRDGRIISVIQPELVAGCTRTMLAGLGELTKWLTASKSPLADILLLNGRLNLRETNVAEAVLAINDWRAQTGWQPVPADVAQCAGADF